MPFAGSWLAPTVRGNRRADSGSEFRRLPQHSGHPATRMCCAGWTATQRCAARTIHWAMPTHSQRESDGPSASLPRSLGSTHRHPRHPSCHHPNPVGHLNISATIERAVGASPTRHRDTPVISPVIMGSPARRHLNPITRCWDQPHHRYAGTTTDEAPTEPPDTKRITLITGCSYLCEVGRWARSVPHCQRNANPGSVPLADRGLSPRPLLRRTIGHQSVVESLSYPPNAGGL